MSLARHDHDTDIAHAADVPTQYKRTAGYRPPMLSRIAQSSGSLNRDLCPRQLLAGPWNGKVSVADNMVADVPKNERMTPATRYSQGHRACARRWMSIVTRR